VISLHSHKMFLDLVAKAGHQALSWLRKRNSSEPSVKHNFFSPQASRRENYSVWIDELIDVIVVPPESRAAGRMFTVIPDSQTRKVWQVAADSEVAFPKDGRSTPRWTTSYVGCG